MNQRSLIAIKTIAKCNRIIIKYNRIIIECNRILIEHYWMPMWIATDWTDSHDMMHEPCYDLWLKEKTKDKKYVIAQSENI